MLTGHPLFTADNDRELYFEVMEPIVFQDQDNLNETEKEFLSALLQRDPNKRLGCMPQEEETIINYESQLLHRFWK